MFRAKIATKINVPITYCFWANALSVNKAKIAVVIPRKMILVIRANLPRINPLTRDYRTFSNKALEYEIGDVGEMLTPPTSPILHKLETR